MFSKYREMVLLDFDSYRWLDEDLCIEGGPGTKLTRGWHDPKVTVVVERSDIIAFTGPEPSMPSTDNHGLWTARCRKKPANLEQEDVEDTAAWGRIRRTDSPQSRLKAVAESNTATLN
ncbi:hypothetical protein G7046_g9952 [Stylonectria norvegica]|nr:hypothetical protein G7046_g9952 [Stylonectria norvegica]